MLMLLFFAGWVVVGQIVLAVGLLANWRSGSLRSVPVRDYWIVPFLVLLWPVVARELWRAYRRGLQGLS